MSVRFGTKYRDSISGFVGIAVARTEHLYAPPRVQLVAETGATGDEKERWFDEMRLSEHQDVVAGFGEPT